MRLPELLQQKMGLHEISRELQLRVCNQGQPHASLLRVRGAELFYWGEKEGGERRDRGSRVRGFWLAESLSGKKTVFLLPFGLAFRAWELPILGSWLLFNRTFCLLIFYTMQWNIIQSLKWMKFWYRLWHEWTSKIWNKWNKQKQILYDSIYMRYLEDTNSYTDSRTKITRGWG